MQALQHEYFSNLPGPTPPAALVEAGFLNVELIAITSWMQARPEKERPQKRKSMDADVVPPKRLEF